jgi:anionic cell wall polymer biosynthesis LytR-Cps2A-Psr (LCP) family protein
VLDEAYPDDLNANDPYAYLRLCMPAGPQRVDGTTALEYVRSRHGDLQSDFGRWARQQQVFLAVKTRVEDTSIVTHVPARVGVLKDHVRTDLTARNPSLAQLTLLSRNVGIRQIHQQVLSAPRFASLGTSPDGSARSTAPRSGWSLNGIVPFRTDRATAHRDDDRHELTMR